MNKSAQFPFNVPDFGALAGAPQPSFEAMSRAYSEWLRNANRVQAELIRFVGDRFNKDVSLIARFANCRQADEFVKLQSEAMTELANDYLQQGARIFALFNESSKAAVEEFSKSPGGKRAQ